MQEWIHNFLISLDVASFWVIVGHVLYVICREATIFYILGSGR